MRKDRDFRGPGDEASMMIAGGDCGFRFVICADPVAADHAFLIYGPQFARLLGLRQQPAPNLPIARQVPRRYLLLFTDGVGEAISQAEPVRISGAVVHDFGQIELYRAAFMPLAGELKSASQLVFGTFNRRIGPKVWAADAFSQTENWVGYDIPSGHDPGNREELSFRLPSPIRIAGDAAFSPGPVNRHLGRRWD